MSEVLDPASVFIETNRLFIRPPKPGDGVEYDKAVRSSLSDLRKPCAALPWAHAEPSEEHSEKYCKWAVGEFMARRDFPLLFISRKTNEIVGASGLHEPDWSVPSFEIGWWGRTGFHGQGLITEGAGAVLKWGFRTLKARRIYAEVDTENAESWRICERIGMKYEGLMCNVRATPDGQLRDCRLYASIG